MISPDNLIWIDLEMTGLDPSNDVIIEIATVVTDNDLNMLAEGPNLAVRQPKAALDGMDEWNQKTHGNSGLVSRVLASQTSNDEAERVTIEFLQKWVPKGASPMCGNSIHQDRRFLERYMPNLEAYFHYRNLDVSTIKELVRRWRPDFKQYLQKKGTHLALEDIRESLAELDFYRKYVFNFIEPPQDPNKKP